MFVYLKSENHEAAISLGEHTVEAYQRVLGTEHRRTLVMQQSYAKALMSAGKLEEEAGELKTVDQICRAKYAETTTMAGTLGHLVTTLVSLDRGSEAEPFARELLTWCENKSAGKAVLGRCHLWIARTLFAQDRLEEAEQSLTKAIELMTGSISDDHWSLSFSHMMAHVIAVKRGATEQTVEVETMYRRLLSARDQMSPEDKSTILPEARRMIQSINMDPDEFSD